MNAWLESGRTNTFVGVLQNDVVFRTSSHSNTLTLGNGTNPNHDAAMYVNRNCIGINKLPCPTQSFSLDVHGVMVSRSNTTWCDQGASSSSILAGSNVTRLCALGLVMNDGTRDTINLKRDGTIKTAGTVQAMSGTFGSPGLINTQVPVLSVEGRGDFRDGLCVSFTDTLESVSDTSLSYDHVHKSLSVGSRATIDTKGLAIKGCITSSGYVFAPAFKVLSDARLKENIQPSDADEDLRAILALDVKRYSLIDNGSERIKEGQTGVLAHELCAVIPNALSRVADYLPNVMAHTCVESHVNPLGPTWLMFPDMESGMNIHIGDHIRVRVDDTILTMDVVDVCMDDKMIRTGICVLGSASNKVSFHGLPLTTNVFVYGTLCNDIMAVDTAQILFRLVSAIQVLNAEVKELKESRSFV